jgi:hypothetical protein
VLDSGGWPRISYLDPFQHDLKYAYKDAVGWHIVVLTSSGVTGFYSSQVLDSGDMAHISFFQMDQGALKHLPYKPGSWPTMSTVDAGAIVGSHTSLKLVNGIRPRISYHDNTNGTLKVASLVCIGSCWWLNQTVDDSGRVGQYTSLALDSAGWAHVMYYDVENHDLKYARQDSSGWHLETVDSGWDVGKYTSLVLDGYDRPWVSYYDQTSRDLKYAFREGSTWQIRSLDTGNVHGFTAITLDLLGFPHIIYRVDDELKYASLTVMGWEVETVGSFAGLEDDYGVSLTFGGTGWPHICYTPQGPYSGFRDLIYAFRDQLGWHPEVVDRYAGNRCAMALDTGGRVHLGYQDRRDDDLKYARRDGSGWLFETVEAVGDIGGDLSLTLDAAGRPRMAYQDATGGDLKYAVRETDSLYLPLILKGW